MKGKPCLARQFHMVHQVLRLNAITLAHLVHIFEPNTNMMVPDRKEIFETCSEEIAPRIWELDDDNHMDNDGNDLTQSVDELQQCLLHTQHLQPRLRAEWMVQGAWGAIWYDQVANKKKVRRQHAIGAQFRMSAVRKGSKTKSPSLFWSTSWSTCSTFSATATYVINRSIRPIFDCTALPLDMGTLRLKAQVPTFEYTSRLTGGRHRVRRRWSK